jgi:hypothetical protein
MPSVVTYNTSDPTSTNQPLTGSGGATPSWISGIIETGNEGNLVGSVFTDQPGTLLIKGTFEDPNGRYFSGHWDIQNSISVLASAGQSISEQVVAPFVQISFTNTSATAQTVLRLFIRLYTPGRS